MVTRSTKFKNVQPSSHHTNWDQISQSYKTGSTDKIAQNSNRNRQWIPKRKNKTSALLIQGEKVKTKKSQKPFSKNEIFNRTHAMTKPKDDKNHKSSTINPYKHIKKEKGKLLQIKDGQKKGETDLGIMPSAWMPCSRQYSSQQEFPTWIPACPMWMLMISLIFNNP